MGNTELFSDIDIRRLERLDDKAKLREIINIIGLMAERLDHAFSSISEENLCEKLRETIAKIN